DGPFAPSLAAAPLLGVGTAMVYPTLLAAVTDVAQPRDRGRAVGVYRFWRDFGFVAGGLVAGFGADALGSEATIAVVAGLTGLSGALVAATPVRSHERKEPRCVPSTVRADSGSRARTTRSSSGSRVST